LPSRRGASGRRVNLSDDKGEFKIFFQDDKTFIDFMGLLGKQISINSDCVILHDCPNINQTILPVAVPIKN